MEMKRLGSDGLKSASKRHDLFKPGKANLTVIDWVVCRESRMRDSRKGVLLHFMRVAA